MKMVEPHPQNGFDCQFVETPASYLQTDCPVCLHILREPYQVTCCGKSYCKVCLEQVQADNKPCPCCNSSAFQSYSNLGLKQAVYAFKVYCGNKGHGCEWIGELGQLDKHLNLNPAAVRDDQLNGCGLARIQCHFCFEYFKRSELSNHQEKLCDKRPLFCEYCNNYKNIYEDVVNNHWPVCGFYPVECPNNCGESPQRQNLEQHIATNCPLTIIDCELQYTGCKRRLLRKDMPDHLRDDLVSHFSLLAISHKKQQEEIVHLRNQVSDLQQQAEKQQIENRKFQEIIQDDSSKVKMNVIDLQNDLGHVKKILRPYTYPPCDIKLPVFFMDGALAASGSTSTPFYSHYFGYKFSIFMKYSYAVLLWDEVYVHISLCPGEDDRHLKWPVSCSVIAHIINQKDDSNHYTINVDFNEANVPRSGSIEKKIKFSRPEFFQLYVSKGSVTFHITSVNIK